MNSCLRLNWYLVPFFGVHRMCVPYGMWGLKTQQVKQSDRTIGILTRSAREGKNLFSRCRSQWKICGVYNQRRREAVYFPSTTNTRVQCIQNSGGYSGSVTAVPCLCLSDILLTWQRSFLPQLLCFRETMLCNLCCGNGELHTLRFTAHDTG